MEVVCHHEDKFLLNASLVDIEQLGCVGNPADAELVADDSGWGGTVGLREGFHEKILLSETKNI